MTTRLAIVGASVRAASQSALWAGFEVVGADLFADADLDGVCPITKIENYPHGLADWLAKQDVDAWMYTGALENYPELVDHMTAIKPLWGASGAALRRCRDPLVLQEVFVEAACIGFPETLPIGQPPAGEGVWLAKTYRHAAGAGVWRFGEQPQGKEVYAQRFVDGEALAAVFAVSDDDAALLGVTRQLVESFHYRGSIGPAPLSAARRSALQRIGDCLRLPLGLRGIVGVDLVAAAEKLYVIEINPRYTASVEVIEKATGVAAVAAHAACFGEERSIIATPQPDKHAGKRILYATRPIQIGQSLAAELLDLQRAGRVADVPHAGTAINAGEPIVTIRVEGASSVGVVEGLDALAEGLLARLATRG